jgi:hypothetical protein
MPEHVKVAVEIVGRAEERTAPRAPGRPGAVSAELRSTLFRACTAAAGGTAECIDEPSATPANAAPSPAAAPGVALVVTWKDEWHVRIAVSAQRGGAAWSSRELEFHDDDARLERWRAAGYAAGTLAAEFITDSANPSLPQVGAAEPSASGTSASAAATPPSQADTGTASVPAPASTGAPANAPPAEPRTAASAVAETEGDGEAGEPALSREPYRPRTLPHGAADVGLVVGPAFSAGPGSGGTRIGGTVRGAALFEGPFVTAAAGYAAYSGSEGAPSASYVTASAGAGYAAVLGPFDAGVRAELVAERLSANGTASSGRSGTSGRWMGALRGGLDVAWMPLSRAGIVVSGDALLRAAETVLRLDGSDVATVPRFDIAGTAGIRLAFP